MDNGFGGDWTEEKLTLVRKYLGAYTKVLKKRNFRTIYLDAFAGSGFRNAIRDAEVQDMFVDVLPAVLKGSPRIALEVTPRFQEYIFVEQDRKKCEDLERLRAEHPAAADDIQIVQSEANEYLMEFCRSRNWRTDRAVIFLDPYGLQVDWATIEAIARTKAIDLWYLFPLGMGVNRLLTVSGNIPPAWRDKLNRLLGADDWQTEFYRQPEETDLLGDQALEKTANFRSIASYLVSRLKTVFPGVAENPKLLYNSTNNPLYLLVFAAANDSGAEIAIKIAQHILRESKGRRG